jgi:hypothetical protein
VTINYHATTAPFHAVRFYESEEEICRVASEFIAEGIEAGEPAVVIARARHRARILDGLRDHGIDPDRLQASDDLLVLDAHDTLAALTANGQPNATLLDEHAGRMFQRICHGRKDCTVWAYGEMVDLLWESGNPVGAMVMEILWNKLAASWKLCILCGYSSSNVYNDDNITDICGQHTHAFGVEAALKASGPTGDQPGG